MPMKLFPMKLPNGRIVLNELCQCGHVRTQHGGLIHHGMCLAVDEHARRRKLRPLSCRCEKYSFAEWVLLDDATK